MLASVFFPLRSNAKALVTGTGVESVRRRLKLASLVFERVVLEGGHMSIQAGPSGSAALNVSPSEDGWQTTRARGAAQRSSFYFAVGSESTPGTPASNLHTVINSEASISWEPTLMPFLDELPKGASWFEWVRVPRPSSDLKRITDGWARIDRENDVLVREMPVEFARKIVIDHSNSDLGLATANDTAISFDDLHGAVIRGRAAQGSNWSLTGFALPLLFPWAPALPWDSIGALRDDRHLSAYRQILFELERSIMDATVEGGDLERAVHQAYGGLLAKANSRIEKVGGAIAKEVVALAVGVGAGFATMPLTGPLGPLLGAAPSVLQGVMNLTSVARRRRSAAWLFVDARLRDADANAADRS